MSCLSSSVGRALSRTQSALSCSVCVSDSAQPAELPHKCTHNQHTHDNNLKIDSLPCKNLRDPLKFLHLQDGPSSQGDQLEALRPVHLGRQTHQMVKKKLGRLRFPRTTLSADDDSLVLSVLKHRMVRPVGHCEYMRRQLLQ